MSSGKGNNKSAVLVAGNNSKLLNSLAEGTVATTGPQLGIGQQVNKFINQDFNGIILASLLVLLIVLVIYLYNRTFIKLNDAKKTEITYHKALELQKLPKCDRLKPELQHRLCDYYIAASYNTPAIGKQSVDYVSTDMVRRVLLNGARYIQIPIAADGVVYDSNPVVATAASNLITSLNSLPLREVLAAIKDTAFKFIAPETTDTDRPVLRSINYPLIIHLKLHTNNDGVLDHAAEDIRELLGDMLLDPKPYRTRPITFEPLCSLLNRIILISSPGYEASRLSELVVPMPRQFWQIITVDSVQPELMNEEDRLAYFRSLSQTQQKARVAALGKLSSLIRNQEGGNTPTANELINSVLGPDAPSSERLTLFNIVGMTLVEPVQKSAISGTAGVAIDSPNYNPADAIMTGCQLIAMNYQTNDETMLGYINIFRKSSYVLKPSGLRLPASEQVLADTIGSFDLSNNMASGGKTDTAFILRYGKGTDYLRLIAQSTAAVDDNRSDGNMPDANLSDGGIARTLLINGERLRVAPVSPSITTAALFETSGFVLRSSPLNSTKNGAGNLVMIASAAQPDLVITINPDFDKGAGDQGDVYLAPVSTTAAASKWQSFQPEYPAIVPDTTQTENRSRPEYFISFRLYPPGFRDAFYLGAVRTQIKLIPKNDDNAGLLVFGILRLPILRQIRVASASGLGTLRIFAGGVVSLSQSAPLAKGALLAMEPAPTSGTQLGNQSISIYLRDTNTNKYLVSTGSQLAANLARPDTRRSVFILTQAGDQTTLIDFGSRFLFADQTGTLLFKTDQPIIQREVRNSQGRIVKPARYGASLGSGKYFMIDNEFAPITK